ncbi:MAG: ABC transporter permease [Magnetococcales bacterium]|nr:ABC transporter permease [Magnetococcales bacterium]MBF0149159.1 ABC transporter permease [Magnetococcales bacterium]
MKHPFATPLLLRSSLRHFLGHPWMTILAMFGIALGVAVVTAVDLANEGAMRAMRLTMASLSGHTTHRLSGPTTGMEEHLFGPLRWADGVQQAAPIVEGVARLVTFPDRTLRIMGVDPIADAPIRPHLTRNTRGVDLKALVTIPGTALLSTRTATRFGIRTGDTMPLKVGEKKHEITIIGLLDVSDPLIRQGLADTLVMDVASAQELLDFQGRLTRIDLVLTPGSPLPPAPKHTRWIETERRTRALEGLTESFRLNLAVLGMLALMVGMFIIFNTITFSVVRRRHIIGLLRAQGVTRQELLVQLFADGLLLGIPGTLLGLLLGLALGQGLLGLVVQTINDLYFELQVTRLPLDPWSLAKGGLLGIGATLIATWPAAWEAVAIPPSLALTRSTLEHTIQQGVQRAGRWGAGILLLGGLILLLPGQNLYAGFAALGCFTVGAALLVPTTMMLLVGWIQPMVRRWLPWTWTLALGAVPRNLSRTGVAVAALTLSVATTIGMGILVESFRDTVERWLTETVASDIYVSTGETSTGAGVEVGILDPELIATLSRVPGIESVGLGRRVSLDTPEGLLNLFVLDIDQARFSERWFLKGNAQDLWPPFQRGEIVVISESLAFRRKLDVGATLELPTPTGLHSFPIAGIHADFRADTGSITVSRTLFARYWDDPAMASMGIRIRAGETVETVMDRLNLAAGPAHSLEIQSNRGLREASLEIFDRTFAVTRVLRLLSVVIAFFGIWTALMAIQLERTRELAVFRALGMTRGEVLRLNLLETTFMGIIAGGIAMPLGWFMGLLLVEVINHRSFGWSLQMTTSPAMILQAMVIAVPTALLAGLIPSWHMARTPPLEALREQG